MNALMIDVARDRQANGAHFDNIFKNEMIRRYNKENTRNPVDSMMRKLRLRIEW
jgi:hypothetical protein